AVQEGTLAPDRGGDLVAGGGVRPGGEDDAAVGEGDQGAEPGVAVDELPGAVDGVDDPHRRVLAQRPVDAGVVVHRLLADHGGAGQQGAQGVGQVQLGLAVGVGDQVV